MPVLDPFIEPLRGTAVSNLMRVDEDRERSTMLRIVTLTALAVWFVLVGYLLGMLVWRW